MHRALRKLLSADLDEREADTLITVLFLVGVGVQGLACWNAEFSVEQGEAGNIWEPLHYALYGTGVQNFEWAEEYAIRTPLFVFPLALLALPARLLQLRKLEVLFVTRFLFGVLSCGAQQYLARCLRPVLGNSAAVLGLALCIFNHGIALGMSRLGVDSLTLVLHSIAVAKWQTRQAEALIRTCALAALNRPNFAVLAAVMGLHGVGLADPWTWFFYLLFHVVVSLAVLGGLMMATDTWWYGRATFSWLNFVRFNLFQQGADNFGRMKGYFYVDKLLLDNNAVLTVAAAVGVCLSRPAGVLALPSMVLLGVLLSVPHKEYRFLFPILPVMGYVAGAGLCEVSRRLGAAGRALACFVLFVHVWSGLSLMLLQAHVYAPHATFARQAEAAVAAAASDRAQRCASPSTRARGVDDAVCSAAAAEGAGGVTCLCTFPWCSWLLPSQCRTVYSTCVYEEFFAGYAAVTYRRFENRTSSALLNISPEDGSYTYRQWHEGTQVYDQFVTHEARRLKRLSSGGRRLDPEIRKALDTVDLIFFYEISSSPHKRFRTAYLEATGTEAPEVVIHHLYSDLMLRPYLEKSNLELLTSAVGISEPGIFNFDPHERLFGLWATPSSWASVRPYTIHSLWSRMGTPKR